MRQAVGRRKSMKENLKIIGYYRRERDGNEYIHYLENGEEHLTSGIYDWSNKNDAGRINRYMKQLIKVEKINIERIKDDMKKYFHFNSVLKII